MEKAYNSQEHEDTITKKWLDSGYFNPDQLPARHTEPYSIVLPPPNVTGTLHLGHAVMLALEDVMIRYARMRGKKTVWLPGTDHAAIATQTKVEKMLIEKGMKHPRNELGREKFLQAVEQFAAESHDTIVHQMKKMGVSVDWSREAYTLDEPRSRAVNALFQLMVDKGLVYRGNRIVNWCARCQSTLADDEVEYKEETTKFYYFKYGPVVIGTARPETKFLDKTIVVHPDDPRFIDIAGKEFDVDWIEGRVQAQVIADPVVDSAFGTGAMTITPAHSKEDYDLAKKYNLPIVQIIDELGNFTSVVGKRFAGKNAHDSRDEIVAILQQKGLVDRIDEQYVHNVSVCYRCGNVVEPLLKLQWFIDVAAPFTYTPSARHPIAGLTDGQQITLKQAMRHVVETQQIQIVPERFKNVYYHWVDQLRDWNISRQIWYGHRIPVWYRGDEMQVSVDQPEGDGWQQDPDTFDTWFSSGAWTFSTLGWPDATNDLTLFHPTSVLETGYDILFLWVSRMILMSTAALGEVPFRKVYLHGLVRDAQGRKMSKSLGNIIDPLTMTEKYGTDALRMSLVIGTTPGNDTRLSEEKIAGYRNFVNKLWNVARYIQMNTQAERSGSINHVGSGSQSLADRWILSRLQRLIADVTNDMERDQYGLAGEKLYNFLWHEFADWYIEMSKVEGVHSTAQRDVLGALLHLLHPMMPFVTEVIARELGFVQNGELLIIADWPHADERFIDEQIEQQIGRMQSAVTELRNIRATLNVPHTQLMEAKMSRQVNTAAGEIELVKLFIEHFGRLKIVDEEKKVSATVVTAAYSIGVILSEEDMNAAIQRIEKEMQQLEKYIAGLTVQLGNEQYIANAPAAVVEETKQKQADANAKLQQLRAAQAGLR